MEIIKQLPRLESNRLWLRALSTSDITKIVAYANNQNISNNTMNIPYPYWEEDAKNWILMGQEGLEEGNRYTFAIALKPNDEFIGGISLGVEQLAERALIGYWLAEPFWNKGYTTEAAKTIISFGFEQLKLNKLYSTHLAHNLASGKVMSNNGMIKEAELVDHVRKGNKYHTLIQYRITKSEYENLK